MMRRTIFSATACNPDSTQSINTFSLSWSTTLLLVAAMLLSLLTFASATMFSSEAWLVYNGSRTVKIDRKKVADACNYFCTLLEGSFKESKQQMIEINLGEAFSFEAFDCIIKFANEGIFRRDPSAYPMHIEAIQLAISWGYDKFVTVLQDHLIEQNITRQEIDVLTALARDNLPILQNLYDACDRFAESMAKRLPRPILRCPKDGHEGHVYLHCLGPEDGELDEDDWEKTVSMSMTEDEKNDWANTREDYCKKRWLMD